MRPSYIMSFIVRGGFMADNESDPIFDSNNSSVRRQGTGTDTIDTRSSKPINNPGSAYHQDTRFSFKVTCNDVSKKNTEWREITVKLPKNYNVIVNGNGIGNTIVVRVNKF